jgi:ferredoxin
MDAVIAMDGEGPAAGNPKKVGALLASQDPVALDAVASNLVGFNPMDIYTTCHAHERGLGIGRIGEIEILGDDFNSLCVKDFEPSIMAVGLLRRKIPLFLYSYIQNQLTFIPEVRENQCTKCNECFQVCPKGAVKEMDGSVLVEKELCIHCMCCHEVCRFQAIKLKQSLMGRLFSLLIDSLRKIKAILS